MRSKQAERKRYINRVARQVGVCCLCGGEIDTQMSPDGSIFWSGGHNAEPLKEGRCCTDCNVSKVIPARLEAMAVKA
jgi:hypothetical protein